MDIAAEVEELKARFPWLGLYIIDRGGDDCVEGLCGMLHLWRTDRGWFRYAAYEAPKHPTLTAAVEAAAELVRPLAPAPVGETVEVRGWVAVSGDGAMKAVGWNLIDGERWEDVVPDARQEGEDEVVYHGNVLTGYPFTLRVPKPKPPVTLVGTVEDR